MKTYTVKPEYIDFWSGDPEFCENPVVDEAELNRLANEWGATVEDLMYQLTENSD